MVIKYETFCTCVLRYPVLSQWIFYKFHNKPVYIDTVFESIFPINSCLELDGTTSHWLKRSSSLVWPYHAILVLHHGQVLSEVVIQTKSFFGMQSSDKQATWPNYLSIAKLNSLLHPHMHAHMHACRHAQNTLCIATNTHSNILAETRITRQSKWVTGIVVICAICTISVECSINNHSISNINSLLPVETC